MPFGDKEEDPPIDVTARTSTSRTLVISEAHPDADETSPPQQNVEHLTPVASPCASSPKRARIEPGKEYNLLIGGSATPSMDDLVFDNYTVVPRSSDALPTTSCSRKPSVVELTGGSSSDTQNEDLNELRQQLQSMNKQTLMIMEQCRKSSEREKLDLQQAQEALVLKEAAVTEATKATSRENFMLELMTEASLEMAGPFLDAAAEDQRVDTRSNFLVNLAMDHGSLFWATPEHTRQIVRALSLFIFLADRRREHLFLIPLTATCSSLPSPSSKPYPAPPPCRRRPIFYPLHKRLQGKTSRKVQKIQNFQSPSSPKKDRRRTTVPRRRSPRRVRGWSCRGVLVLYAEGQERKLLQDDATDLAVVALFFDTDGHRSPLLPLPRLRRPRVVSIFDHHQDAGTEECHEEFACYPEEDIACASTADPAGEPTLSPILLLHALLIYCYPCVAILLCHVSYPPVTYMSEIHLLALPIVCCLPALRVVGEFRVLLISRDVRDILLGGYHMLYLLLEIITFTLLLTTKIVSRGICEPLCESIGTLTC
nr:uncharacterized protein LOC127310137 [Lolium perenne]